VFNEGGPDTEPDIARLAALLEATELAVVVEGSSFDARRRKANRVLGRADEAAALLELRAALRCVSGAERTALMTPGEPSIALFAAGRDYLTAVTVIGPGRIRSYGLLDGDVLLAEPERLARWLAVTAGTGHWPWAHLSCHGSCEAAQSVWDLY
jgi:hypothetical protein